MSMTRAASQPRALREAFMRGARAIRPRTDLAADVAHTLDRSVALDRLLSAPLPISGVSKMPTVASLADRIRAVRRKRDDRFAAIERDHLARVDAAEKRQAEALDKLEQKLSSDVALDEAEVRALEDEVNQLTNGAPA